MFVLTFCCCALSSLILLTLAILAGFKIFMILTTGVYSGTKKLHSKTVIVTGANTGIGKEAARDFAKRGARVILACRDSVKGNQAKDEIIRSTGNRNVVYRKLDLSSLTSVREFAKNILLKEPHLHILVNNAGAGGLGNTRTEDGLQLGMQVNHFGPFLLTNLLLDLMKRSTPARIIFVSSLAHKYASFDINNLNCEKRFNDIQVYNYSKLCNVLNANELARRLKGTGVTANSLHPGAVATEVFRKMSKVMLAITNWFAKYFFKTPVEGAQTTIYLAVADEVEGVTGKYFADCKEAKMSSLAKSETLARKVWDKSEQCVSLGSAKKR